MPLGFGGAGVWCALQRTPAERTATGECVRGRRGEPRGEPAEEALGLAILERLRMENLHVSGALALTFREHRVRSATKAEIANRIYAVVRSQRLLDHVIDRLAASPLRGRARDRHDDQRRIAPQRIQAARLSRSVM